MGNTQLRKKDCRVLMVGLDDAGKTTIMYRLKFGQAVTTIPTVGFNFEKISFKNVRLTVLDFGGQEKIRPLWRHHYEMSQGVIFVVDSNNRERISEAEVELKRLLFREDLSDAAVVIFANKKDEVNALTAAEITEKLELTNYQQRQWHVQETCAVTGEGIQEGLSWLCEKLNTYKPRKTRKNSDQ